MTVTCKFWGPLVCYYSRFHRLHILWFPCWYCKECFCTYITGDARSFQTLDFVHILYCFLDSEEGTPFKHTQWYEEVEFHLGSFMFLCRPDDSHTCSFFSHHLFQLTDNIECSYYILTCDAKIWCEPYLFCGRGSLCNTCEWLQILSETSLLDVACCTGPTSRDHLLSGTVLLGLKGQSWVFSGVGSKLTKSACYGLGKRPKHDGFMVSIRYNFSTLRDVFPTPPNLVTQLNNVMSMIGIKTYNSMHKLFVSFPHKIEDYPFDKCASYVPTLLPCMIITSFWCKYIYCMYIYTYKVSLA